MQEDGIRQRRCLGRPSRTVLKRTEKNLVCPENKHRPRISKEREARLVMLNGNRITSNQI